MSIFDSVAQFFSGWRFPVVMISTMLFMVVLMAVTLLIPESDSAAAAFARDFKVWCFGYDPSTGELEWAYVWMFLVQPWVMMALVAFVWMKPLRQLWGESRSRMVPYVLGTLVFVLGVSGAVVASGGSSTVRVDATPFPGERIRTAVPAPDFTLVNHDNELVSLESLAGEVVVLTAVYTRCGYTCPLILNQVKGLVSELDVEETGEVRALAITLDPKHDSVQDLKRMTETYGMSTPGFQALTGEVDAVESTLDRYGFARTVDTETGVINHANLFVLIDRNGKIAFRFALGETQQSWMRDAVQMLVDESPAPIAGYRD